MQRLWNFLISNRFVRLLRERNFWLLTAGQSISLFGDRINNMALLALLGARYTHSTFAFSGLAVFVSLPAIFLSPISGIIADRFNRKHIMLTMEISRGVLVVLIPLLFSLFSNIMIVYTLVFLLYTLTIIYNNAKMSLIPEMIKDRGVLWDFNALMGMAGKIAMALGVVFGGVLVDMEIWKRMGFEGWEVGFYIDSITYFFSALMVYFITIEVAPEIRKRKLDFHELVEEERGWLLRILEEIKYALGIVLRRGILKFFYLSIINTMLLVAVIYNLYFPYIQQGLGYGTKGIGFVVGAGLLGVLLGTLMFSRIAITIGEITSIALSNVVLALFIFLSIFYHGFFALMVLFFIGGILMAPLFLSYDTFLQRAIPSSIRGKMFSFKEMFWAAGFLLWALFLGFVSEILKRFVGFEASVRIIIVGASVLIILSTIILLKLLPRIRKKRR